MKTTIELPDRTFRRAKTVAAANGVTLKQLLTEALEEKLRQGAKSSRSAAPPWLRCFGAFANSPSMRVETRRIQRRIDAEFERIDPEDWQ
ncbi:MAG: nucleotidyltransferase [Verrucomicrobia bacterium]|nr:nucleotidyltransferase [Verrucomicrobiota bacterium]